MDEGDRDQGRVQDRDRLPIYPMGAAERLTGLTSRQIRYYEAKGLIRPRRTLGNQRIFSSEEIRRLKWIQRLLQEGHSVDSIRTLIKAGYFEAGEEETQ